MKLDIYNNYILTDSVRVGSSAFVLGIQMESGKLATWKRITDEVYTDQRDFDDLFLAQKDLVERASEEVKFVELCQAVKEQNKSRKERER